MLPSSGIGFTLGIIDKIGSLKLDAVAAQAVDIRVRSAPAVEAFTRLAPQRDNFAELDSSTSFGIPSDIKLLIEEFEKLGLGPEL